MSSDFADAALMRLFDTLDLKVKGISTKEFMAEYCVPMHRAQMWEKNTRQKFSKVIPRCPAFTRVLELLKTERGRQKMLPFCYGDFKPLKSGVITIRSTLFTAGFLHYKLCILLGLLGFYIRVLSCKPA